MNLYKKFTKDVGIVAISELIMKLRPIFFLPIITKALGASDYGIYTTLFVTLSFLGPLATMRVNSSIVRFFSGEKDKKKVARGVISITLFVAILSFSLALVMCLFSDILADTVFGSPGSGAIISLGAFLLPLTVLTNTIFSFFRMRQKMVIFSIFRILNNLLPIFLAIIFLLNGHGLIYVIYSFIIVQTVLVIASTALMIRDTGLSKPNLRILKPYLNFGLPLVPAGLSSVILNLGDRYVLGFIVGSAAVGIYSVSYNLGHLLLFLVVPITSALLAPLSKAYEEGRFDMVRNYLNYSFRYFLMFSIPATVGLSVLAMPLIRSLTTSEFLVGSDGVTAVIALSHIFYGLYSIAIKVLLLVKRTKITAILVTAVAVTNIALNLALVPILGIMGATISTLVCFVALLIVTWKVATKHIPLSIDPIFLAKCILASVAMGLLISLFNPIGWLRISLTTLLGVLFYFGLLFVFKTFKKNEMKFFRSFLKNQEETLA